MNRADELLLKLRALRKQVLEVEMEILSMQKECKHENRATIRERDDMELRYYDRNTCPDCNKMWYE